MFIVLGYFHSKAQCMELKVIENQLILSGKVVAADSERVRDALAAAPWLNTVILRNSPGGDAPAGYRIGELVREKGGVGRLLHTKTPRSFSALFNAMVWYKSI